MSRRYEMKYEYKEVRLTIIDFACEPYKRTYAPSKATLDRFTEVGNLAAAEQRPERPFELLYSDDGFGWTITSYVAKRCACGKAVYEFENGFVRRQCLHCWLDGKVAALQGVKE